MKKNYYYLFIVFCLLSINIRAQFYSHGDISVSLQPMVTHDTTICSSDGQLLYMITIDNSFVGDSVIVKDMATGMIISEEMNTTGQTPWNVVVPNFMAFGTLPDDQLSSGMAFFYGPPSKVISGTDTVYNIGNAYGDFITNPCHYGSVSGKVYVDNNGDCSFNGSDVALNSIVVLSNVALNSPSILNTSSYAYTTNTGSYGMSVQESWMTNYSVSIPPYYQFIFPLTSCTPSSYNFTTLPQSNVDFSLQCSTNMDVRCGLQSPGNVRPGIPFIASPFVNNTGCGSASGVLKLVLDANVVYNAGLSNNPATTIVGDTLMWNYSNLSNLSNGMYWNSFFAGIHLTPSVSLTSGNTICFKVIVNVPNGDVNATNNTYNICLPVVNSYDPNMKEVSPKGVGANGNIPLTTSELMYTIHFQNTGTTSAINISVVDTLDSHLQASSLEILGASHTLTPQWIGNNVVKFNFNGILLPDSTFNEAESHGSVSFKIKLNSSLPSGTQIKNKAYIYFDFNAPILTNTTLNTLVNTTSIDDIAAVNNSISIYPNPSNGMFYLQHPLVKVERIEVYDVLGALIKLEKPTNANEISIDINNQSNGIYFYKVFTIDGTMFGGKLLKE